MDNFDKDGIYGEGRGPAKKIERRGRHDKVGRKPGSVMIHETALRRDATIPGLISLTYNCLAPAIIARTEQDDLFSHRLLERLFIESEARRTSQTVTTYLAGLGLTSHDIDQVKKDLKM